MTKYDALTRYLSSQSYHRVPMTFSQIEEVLQTKLPRSADLYRAWWSNNPSNNVMTKAWLAAGFETEQVDLPERKLIFRRVGPINGSGGTAPKSGPGVPPGGFMEAPSPSFAAPAGKPALFGWMKGTVTVAPDTDLTDPADPEWGSVTNNALLLDTCAAIWIANDEPIAEGARAALMAALEANEPIFVSPITAWEVGLLAARGRITLSMSPTRWFDRLMAAPGLHLATLLPDALIASSFLPGAPPRDPADRIIVATARELGYRVVTRDHSLLAYAKQGYCHALTC